MKKILLAVVSVLLCYSVNSGVKENLSYVRTGDNVYFGADIKAGIFNTKIIDNLGNIVKVPNQNVDVIVHDGRMFEKKPFVSDNGRVLCYKMMEFICEKDGYRLYKYSCMNESCSVVNGLICYQQPQDFYFVFHKGQFHLRIDADNAVAVLPFFGIQVLG